MFLKPTALYAAVLLLSSVGSALAQTSAIGEPSSSTGLFTQSKDMAGKPTGETEYSPEVNSTLPDPGSAGFRLDSGFQVFMRPSLRMGYDDNFANLPDTAAAPARKATTTIFAAPIIVKFTPSLTERDEGTETRLSVNLGITQFNNAAKETQNNNRIAIDRITRYSSRFDSRIGASYLDGTDPRGRVENTGLEVNRFSNTGLVFSAGYGAPSAQGRVEADARINAIEYRNNPELTSFLNRKTTDIAGRFLYRVAPKTRAVFELQRIDTNFKNDRADTAGTNQFFNNQDQKDTRASVGARWDATAKTSGGFRIGRTKKQFDQASVDRPDRTASFYDANIAWSPLTYSSVNFTLGQNFVDSFRTSGAQTVRRRGVSWNHQWLERFSTTLSFTRTLDDFNNFRLQTNNNTFAVNRKDETDVISLAANYRFSPVITVGLIISRTQRDSNIKNGFVLPDGSVNQGNFVSDNFTYDRNLALATISAVF